VQLRKGDNVIVVDISGWGADPRFDAALGGEWQERPCDQEMKKKARSAQALHVRLRGASYIDIVFDGPTHFLPQNQASLVSLVLGAGMQSAETSDYKWIGPTKLRVGPVPNAWAKQVIQVGFPGLRDCLGHPLQVPGVKVTLP
jgi:hypothetical protein